MRYALPKYITERTLEFALSHRAFSVFARQKLLEFALTDELIGFILLEIYRTGSTNTVIDVKTKKLVRLG